MGLVAVVTGATDGIGRAAALALASGGARVLAVGRSQAKGDALLRALAQGDSVAEHGFISADLSRMSEVARAAREIQGKTPRVDVLIHCAGIIHGEPTWTEDGFELNFATNYLSRFLLTRMLEPQLGQSPSPRVVIVASPGSHPDQLDFDNLQLRSGFSANRAFRQGQFANDLWAQALQRKVPGLTVAEVFPGLVKSNIFRASASMPFPLRIAGFVAQFVGSSPESAARIPVACATAVDVASLRGHAFGPGMKRRTLGPTALDPVRQDRLWDSSSRDLAKWLSTPDALPVPHRTGARHLSDL